MKKIFLALSVLILSTCVLAATSGGAITASSGSAAQQLLESFTQCNNKTPIPTYTKAELTQDLLQLQDDIESTMVNLWVFCSKTQFESAVLNTINQLRNGENALDFYRQVAPLLHMIRCEHLLFPISEDNPILTREIFDKSNYFPVEVNVINSRKVLFMGLFNTNQQNKYIGYSITSINGVPIENILNSILKYSNSETEFGQLKSFNNETLGISYFGYAYNIKYGFIKKYKIELSNGRNIKKITVVGMSNEEIMKRLNLELPVFFDNGYSFKMLPNNIGYIKYSKCIGYSNQAFQEFIQNITTQLTQNHCKNLIIDIQGNGGGQDSGWQYMLEAVTNQPFCEWGNKIRISPLFEQSAIKYSDFYQLDCSNVEEFKEYCSKNMGKVVPTQFTFHRNFIPKALWTGNLYLLTNSGIFSAAIDFAEVFKDCKLGYIIGQPTGGTAQIQGPLDNVLLNNTGISISIPYTESLRPNGLPSYDQPIYPDYFSNNALQDAQTMIANLQKMGIN